MTRDCPFCDYSGPNPVLADTGKCIVIEPLQPVVDGHVLVIPKLHVTDAATDPKVTGLVFEIAARWAQLDTQSFPVVGFGSAANLITSIGKEASQSVMHLHVHVVPRRAGDGLALPWDNPDAEFWESKYDELLKNIGGVSPG